MPLEGEEVAERAGDQRREQPCARHRPLVRDRRPGLDERHHVAGEADVEHRLAVEPAHAGGRAADGVGHELHGR
jgi:hypothetical protein